MDSKLICLRLRLQAVELWNMASQNCGGYGVSIISTPEGLMTNKEAKKSGLGGEVLLEIW